MITAYELLIKTNHYLIKGGILTENQKSNIFNQLMSARASHGQASHGQARQINDAVKLHDNTDNSKRIMYPTFYIPPYNNGKKLKTIFNQTPKTQILSANMYELEILRLLYLLEPENAVVEAMINQTLKRLKTTCFGYQDDGVGECFDTSLVVLRFVSSVAKEDTDWIRSRIDNYNHHVNEKKRSWYSNWYYWLCLSEMPFEIAKPEIDKYKELMLDWLYNKSCVMSSEINKNIHPVLFSILRNIMAKYPEYEYIKDREPYMSERDGRLYFDMSL